MNIDFSELELAWRRVKLDRDRVFIRHPYETLLIEQDAKQWLNNLASSLNQGSYSPQPLVLCDVPKTEFTVRPGGQLTAADRVVFAACVGRCLSQINETLTWPNDDSPDCSYQISSDLTKPNWLKSRFECWKSFRDKSLILLDPDITYVVFADVAGFYENIDISTLISDLKFTNSDPDAVQQLSACLNRWGHVPGRSVPQGHRAGDILAKLYLHSIDGILRDVGFRHLRFVDDYRIFCRTRDEAIRALLELTRQLRLRGLVLNSSKSEILIASAAQRKIDGTIPIIEGVRKNVVQLYTKLIGAHYLSSDEKRSVIGQTAEEIPLTLIQSTFEAYFLEERDYVFRATLFHFLIHRLGAAKSRVALDYCLKALEKHPQDTEEILRYLKEVSTLTEVSETLAAHVESKAVYSYQIYQIMEWVGDLKQQLSDQLLAVARKLAFTAGTEPFVRAACIKMTS